MKLYSGRPRATVFWRSRTVGLKPTNPRQVEGKRMKVAAEGREEQRNGQVHSYHYRTVQARLQR